MARPKKPIDPQVVRELAKRQNSIRTIAKICGCSDELLRRRFHAIIDEGRHEGHTKLYDLMWEMLEEKNQFGYKNPQLLQWAIERFVEPPESAIPEPDKEGHDGKVIGVMSDPATNEQIKKTYDKS